MSNLKFVHSGGNSVSLTTPTSNPGSNITFKLPQADGSSGQILQTDGNGNLTFVDKPTGITEADLFRLTSDTTVSGDTDLGTNWERPDTANDGFGKLGTGMSFSGAIWTFPSTGIYHVIFNAMLYGNGGSGTTQFQILATENNSSYGLQSSAHASVTNGTFTSVCPTALIDVTNVSNVKVKLRATSSNSNQLVGSNSAVSLTYVTFIRLGDT